MQEQPKIWCTPWQSQPFEGWMLCGFQKLPVWLRKTWSSCEFLVLCGILPRRWMGWCETAIAQSPKNSDFHGFTFWMRFHLKFAIDKYIKGYDITIIYHWRCFNRMFLFAQNFKRPQCLNPNEPGSLVMWNPKWWLLFLSTKSGEVHFSGNFRSAQLSSKGFSKRLSPCSGHTKKCFILIFILCTYVFIYIYMHISQYLFAHVEIEAGKDSVTEWHMLIATCRVRIRRHPLDSIGPLVGKGISVAWFTKRGNHVELPEMLESFKSTSTGQ